MSRSRENLYFVGFMAVGALLIARPSHIIAGPSVDIAVDVLGLAIVLAGLAVRVVSRDWKVAHSNGQLVTDGPYGICRNPMYLGSLLTGFGLCIIFGSLPFLLLYLAGFLIAHQVIIRREQKYLGAQFGEQYALYLKATPTWFPAVTGFVRLLSGFWPERKALPNAILRERHAIAGNLLAACLLEATADSLVMGWHTARGEAGVWLAAGVSICLLWALAGRIQRLPKSGTA